MRAGIASVPFARWRGVYLVSFTRIDGSQTELPNRRLLARHRACAKMLEVAGAAKYMEALLMNMSK